MTIKREGSDQDARIHFLLDPGQLFSSQYLIWGRLAQSRTLNRPHWFHNHRENAIRGN